MNQDLLTINQIAVKIIKVREIKAMAEMVMEELPGLIPHEKSFFTLTGLGARKRKTRIYSKTVSQDFQNQYIDQYEDTDYTSWYLNQRNVHVYRDSQIMSQEEIEKTEIFKDWIRPQGMKYLCGNVLRNDQVRFGELTLLRSEALGDYTDYEIFLLSLVTDLMLAWCEMYYEEAYEAVSHKPSKSPDSLSPLTEREAEIVKLIKAGMSTREIAEHLSIEYSTVRKHVSNIYRKLGVKTRVQLIRSSHED